MGFSSNIRDLAARLRRFMEASPATASAPSLRADNVEDTKTDEFQLMALELFRHQFQHNLAYRKICEEWGATPRTIECWSRIPAVPTAAFKELELSCLSPQERTTVFFSSGTTEMRPSRHFHDRESLSLYEASVRAGFRNAGLLTRLSQAERPPTANYCDCKVLRLVSLTPDKVAAPHSSLVHMFQTLAELDEFCDSEFFGTTGADGSWLVNLPALQTRLEEIAAAGEPVLLVGTAFSFVHLLDFLAERGITLILPPCSYVLETGGYKGRSRSLPKSELHALISTRLGVRPTEIICEYGMVELSSQAYDYSPRARGPLTGREICSRRFCFPPWARAHVISPESGREVSEGELGLIRVFDLGNAYSVLAIQTEDLAIRRGAGFELLGRAEHAESRGCSLMVGTS